MREGCSPARSQLSRKKQQHRPPGGDTVEKTARFYLHYRIFLQRFSAHTFNSYAETFNTHDTFETQLRLFRKG
jgi:hypothetical protein